MKTNLPTLKPPLARMASIFFGILSLLILLNCNQLSGDQPNSEELIFFEKVQSHEHIDAGEEGHSHGDIRIFEGFMTDTNNNVIGRFTAKQVIGSLPHKNSNPNQVHEDRFTTTIWEFDDGSTIITSGISHYTVGQIEMDINVPRVRAIIGGTGKYMGVRGQYTNTRITDLLYESKFEILY